MEKKDIDFLNMILKYIEEETLLEFPSYLIKDYDERISILKGKIIEIRIDSNFSFSLLVEDNISLDNHYMYLDKDNLKTFYEVKNKKPVYFERMFEM